MDECAFEVEGIRVEISRTPAEPVEDLQYYSTIPKLAKVGDTVRGVPGLVVTVNGEGGWECAARLQDFIMDTASREILTQVVRKGLSELDPLSIDALKQLSAAKARIAELEAEVNRLRSVVFHDCGCPRDVGQAISCNGCGALREVPSRAALNPPAKE